MAALTAFETAVLDERLLSLSRELLNALKQVDRQSALQWGGQAFVLFGQALKRRARNFVSLLKKVAVVAYRKTGDLLVAGKQGRLVDHVTTGTKENWGLASAWTQETAASTWELARLLKDDPWKVAPELVTIVAVSLAVSGGPDGDGGIPDLDLKMGIGAHRSPLTHSILIGSVLEAGIFSVLSLVRLVHSKLPDEHDPFWDEAYDFSDRLSTAAAQGASIGLTYHLFVDGLLQPAAYHGLPVHLSMEGHQALILANAKMEGLDVPMKEGVASSIGKGPSSNPAGSTRTQASESELRAMEARHYRFAAETRNVPARIAALMGFRELLLVNTFGGWLMALDAGLVPPLTGAQERFVAVCRGQAIARSPFERAWIVYLALTSR
jgi:uncharacterized membrane protein